MTSLIGPFQVVLPALGDGELVKRAFFWNRLSDPAEPRLRRVVFLVYMDEMD